MVNSGDLYGPMEVDDDLSTTLGTETLADSVVGARHELGLIRHACLASMLVDDGLGQVETKEHRERERHREILIRQVLSHAAESYSPFLIFQVYNIPCLTAYL